MAQSTWSFDKAHSKVTFSVTHLMISEVSGQFNEFEGEVVSKSDDFADSQIEFTINVGSINTDDEKRDGHLKSEDFFDAEKYPMITFKSKSLKQVKGKNYKLTGDMTIRDVSKEVTLDVIYFGTMKDPYGNTKAGFKITGEINRMDYGVKWNSPLEGGGVVVGETVNLVCNVELMKKK
ncbi:MAG: YceI family protein [Cytophagales bacterium]|nr:YceI family protein [Cytophagales bacterium]